MDTIAKLPAYVDTDAFLMAAGYIGQKTSGVDKLSLAFGYVGSDGRLRFAAKDAAGTIAKAPAYLGSDGRLRAASLYRQADVPCPCIATPPAVCSQLNGAYQLAVSGVLDWDNWQCAAFGCQCCNCAALNGEYTLQRLLDGPGNPMCAWEGIGPSGSACGRSYNPESYTCVAMLSEVAGQWRLDLRVNRSVYTSCSMIFVGPNSTSLPVGAYAPAQKSVGCFGIATSAGEGSAVVS